MTQNKKALFYIFFGLAIFAIFIYLILLPSTLSKALIKIDLSANVSDVKSVWDRYHFDLNEDDEFNEAIRAKLSSFGLKPSEIKEVKSWLPAKTKNLNVILIPDLSQRIKDSINNPNQIATDISLLGSIWEAFEKKVRLKINSKDRLIVDVADPDQGQGQFKIVADSLVFDLADHKNKSNRLYFNQVTNRFSDNIKKIYDISSKKTSGADYSYYFSEKLKTRLKKSTLYDDYRNIVIIITDGYLEINLFGGGVQSVSPKLAQLQQYCVTGNPSTFQYPVQTIDMDLSNIEAYLFEVTERQKGKGCHFKGLRKWWIEWFKTMKVKNAEEDIIFKHQDAVNLSKKEVETIFE